MFHSIDEFQKGWEFEAAMTAKVFGELTDASLAQPVCEGGRTLGSIAWHITTSIPEMAGTAGLKLAGPPQDFAQPGAAVEIAAAYTKLSGAVLDAVKEQWADAQLNDEISMYGQQWTKAFTLGVLCAHQAHHRGQMTVLMRQAGLKVPGVYGPAKEEWAAIGMAAQP